MQLARNGHTVTYVPENIAELGDITGDKALDNTEPGDVAFKIDCSQLGDTMPSSPTIAALIDCHKKLSSKGISFMLKELSDNFRSTLRVSRIDTLLTIQE